jgi:hypothetical protein
MTIKSMSTKNIVRLMAWLPINRSELDSEKVLHLKFYETDRWKPYNITEFAMPDTKMPGIRVSKGFRTSQILLQKGWQYQQKDDNIV